MGGEPIVRVQINGRDEQVEPGTSVAQLVQRYQLQPRHVAVEINCDLVPRASFESTTVHEGDRIEIVTLVGGGREGRSEEAVSFPAPADGR
jgi:sulfur carrier protein